MSNTLTFRIPASCWLTSNRHHTNRGWLASVRRDLHAIASTTAIAYGLEPTTGPVVAEWVVCYPKGVRTDKGEASNAQPTTKALLDGLVPRWLSDDGPRWVLRESFERGPNLSIPGEHWVTLPLLRGES